MLFNFLSKVFGNRNDREINKIKKIVTIINDFEPDMKVKSDSQLKEQTAIFKERLKGGETLDDILPEAFATVREASWRILEMRHFDSQMVGGIALHQGKISEMKTGEGKTLVATLAAYLNALSGKGVHVITVNDYLAKRDSEWMGRLYGFLGLTTSVIIHGLDDEERKIAYGSDIAYGTNNEFGFDYLRDNMKFDKESIVQGYLNFAIVDEVDSILVDEARTPLIISGPAEKSTQLYVLVNNIIPSLKKDVDFNIDEKSKSATLTDEGVLASERALKIDNLYDPKNIELLHHINQALKAYALFKKDVDYIVKNGQVVIVDEFTGRLMPGRRYSEGLHQALEAKEKVKIENENQTLASITFQNYFRMYNKLSGMTGTAETEAAEFNKIYSLDVLVIPTNQPMIRNDFPDSIYKTKKEKYDAALEEIIAFHKKGQPVLVGTVSIDISESFSKKLLKKGIKHTVLNAKNHKGEAEIVANAGQKGAITISTNMAGRGTDIVLGEGVIESGGLHIIGTERHESRRIDNQLRGRSGRQGDPGSSRFFLSLDDDLLRIFGGERITKIMDRLGMEEGEPIEHNIISRAIENAQKKVEGHNFDIRKQLIDYDDVMNQQREIIYKQRRKTLNNDSLKSDIMDMISDGAGFIAQNFEEIKKPVGEWDLKGLNDSVISQFNMKLIESEDDQEYIVEKGLAGFIEEKAISIYERKEKDIGTENIRELEKYLMLQTVDSLWKDHLLSMDHLKEGIGLRGYAQQDPLIVYKKEAFEMFQGMIDRIKEEIVNVLFRVQIASPDHVGEMTRHEQEMVMSHGDGSVKEPIKRKNEKVGRNSPCPCGSGKKFKRCCG